MKDKSWIKKLSVGDVILHESRTDRGVLQRPTEVTVTKIGRKYITGTNGRCTWEQQYDIERCFPDMTSYLAKEDIRKKVNAINKSLTGFSALAPLKEAGITDINGLILALDKCGIKVDLPEGLQ